ncbi:MAG TPA: gluconate 2-dehydrogenase subunit 3 family protein [Acidothermaceae bacterium]|nr:gluconate 2-dehydrogenase subunit 3 family protein [Acidothermaceae bacterium]
MVFIPDSFRGRTPGSRPSRFPGFDVLDEVDRWDAATSGVVLARLTPSPALSFFTGVEQATAEALCDQLLAQHDEPRVPVAALIGVRLATGETDGWHYADMPADGDAWRQTLGFLDEDATAGYGTSFGELTKAQQAGIVQTVQDLGTQSWHNLPANHVWSLWTRYACTAFYSHPWAWNEMGFPGPAYPRGYKNMGLDRREPFEVADAVDADPVRRMT